jgi:hypothetical protein
MKKLGDQKVKISGNQKREEESMYESAVILLSVYNETPRGISFLFLINNPSNRIL